MLIFLGSGSISHCIGGGEGGTGAQRSLHLRIPLNSTIPAVLFACQSDHASQSYANLSRIRQNQPSAGGKEAPEHSILYTYGFPQSHDSSGAICLSIGPRVAELY